MPNPIPRFVRWAVALAVIATLVIGGSQLFQFEATTQTRWGPLGPADRNLLVKVRQAGLWEIPVSELAQQRGASPRVREVGRLLAAEHTDLDQRVRKTAAQLGAQLPNEPTKQQRVWIAEINGKSGADFDRTFVRRLRVAHGRILPVISEVRAGTQNELIRSFADTGHEFVHRHIEYLESTGLVDSAALPTPPVPRTTGLPPGSVPAAEAVPAEVLAGVFVSGQDRQVSRLAQSAVAGGGSVYLAALVSVAAVLLAVVGLLVLVGRIGRHPRQGRHSTQPAARPLAEIPARPRHSAQP